MSASLTGTATETQTQPPANVEKRNKFRTVLGFAPTAVASNPPPSSYSRGAHTLKNATVTERRSVDVTGSGAYFASLGRKKSSRSVRSRVAESAFYDEESSSSFSPAAAASNAEYTNMAQTQTLQVPQERESRRKLVRMEAQDGPWSVSVAETPYDKNSYSIYVKSTSSLPFH